MVFYRSSIFDQFRAMASFTEFYSKSRQQQRIRRSPFCSNCSNVSACDHSGLIAIDFVIMIAVISACGYLLFPYVKFLTIGLVYVVGVVFSVVKEEFVREPVVYGSVALCGFIVSVVAWLVLMCTSRKCGKPGCKGLKNATEFDIQLETEETLKGSSSNSAAVKDGVRKGLFELPREYHRELEAELKKMAPPNGRAVLIFRAKCGCSIGRMEVPGPKKQQRKIKK